MMRAVEAPPALALAAGAGGGDRFEPSSALERAIAMLVASRRELRVLIEDELASPDPIEQGR